MNTLLTMLRLRIPQAILSHEVPTQNIKKTFASPAPTAVQLSQLSPVYAEELPFSRLPKLLVQLKLHRAQASPEICSRSR